MGFFGVPLRDLLAKLNIKHRMCCNKPIDYKMLTKFFSRHHCLVVCSLPVAPSIEDEKVYAIVAKSLLSYITSVPNFWNVIYAKLFVK